MSFTITGTGRGLPDRIVTNNELAAFLDTSDEWITSRTGISERRVMTDESLLDLAVSAAKNALENAEAGGADIDLVIVSTVQGEYISPSMSCLVATAVGAAAARTLDINMGCTGFIYALDAAAAFMDSGRARRALVVCAESMARLADWRERATCVLFGDGAGAVVLERGASLLSLKLGSSGSVENLFIPSCCGNSPFTPARHTETYINMNGQEIYKFAVPAILADIGGAVGACGLTPDDISHFLLHQANIRIIASAVEKSGQPPEKFPHNIERHGNTSSATIPILLDELNRAGKLKKGEKLVFCAFGAGLASGACVINWEK